MAHAQAIQQSIQSQGLPEVLERVLDKGLVIAGDIKIKLCDVELLSIQIRLLVCSVDRAKQMGITWWWEQPAPATQAVPAPHVSPKPLPAPEQAVQSPWEQYVRFQQAMRACEEGPAKPWRRA